MRNIVASVAVFIAVALIPVHAQEQKVETKKEVSSSDVKKETGEAVKTTGTYVKQKKDRYQKKAEEKLRRVEDNVRNLREKAEKSGDRTREKFSKTSEELKSKSEAAKNKLGELKASGEEKWEKVKKELDAMLRDLERTYDRAASRLKGTRKEE